MFVLMKALEKPNCARAAGVLAGYVDCTILVGLILSVVFLTPLTCLLGMRLKHHGFLDLFRTPFMCDPLI